MRHARAVPYTFRDRGYMPAPVSHITGLLMAVTLPLVSGCSVLLAERWDAAKAVADIVRHGVTYSGGAAVFIQELVDAVDAAGHGRAAARMWVQLRWQRDPVRAGAAVRGTGHEAAPRLRDDRVPDGLGQHGRRRPRDPPRHRRADPPRRRRARGRRRRRPTSRPARWGSSSCAARSARSGTSTRSTPATGSTPTAGSAAATSGSSTPSSCITVTGRTKDIINRGGEKLSAQEIEALLRRHPDVADAAVVAAPAPAPGRGAGRVRHPAPRRRRDPTTRSGSSCRPRASPRRRSRASS